MIQNYKRLWIVTGLFFFASASGAAPLDIAELTNFIENNPAAAAKFIESLKPETIGSNFSACGQGFYDGACAFGLALSRLVKDVSLNFNQLGQSAATHYWLTGGVMLGGIWFYWYILPKIKIQVEYRSDNRPPVNHAHALR